MAADFIPQNPPAMVRLTDANSPAHLAARQFRRGVNLGNYLEVPKGQNWGVTFAPEEVRRMRAEGFDHLRVPIGWHHYTGPAPEFKIEKAIFDKADEVVTNALAAGLAVLINIHHFDAFTTNPEAETERLAAIWRQVAAHYAEQPNALAFELINEPKDAAKTTVMNPIYARLIREIRRTNPKRTLFVGPGQWNQVSELKNLVLPAEDNNLIVTVHCYDPFLFTHQGATWAGPDTKVKGIQFPGPPPQPLTPDPALKLNPWVVNWIARYNADPADKNPSGPSAFEEKLKLARAWSDYYGRPVHVGEFGCFTSADPKSRANFYAAFRRVLDEQKLGWAMWDWSAGFRYWDKKKNEPTPGMREALFGKSNSRDPRPGQ
ncbi:MAG: glycoside hydrolase family 5 protein [Verrucomicrobiota bacterium]